MGKAVNGHAVLLDNRQIKNNLADQSATCFNCDDIGITTPVSFVTDSFFSLRRLPVRESDK